MAIPGLKRFEAGRAVATPDGSELPYQRIAELTFEDVEALQAGLGSEEGQAAVNDIPNFATGGVTIFFARSTDAFVLTPRAHWFSRPGVFAGWIDDRVHGRRQRCRFLANAACKTGCAEALRPQSLPVHRGATASR